MRKENIYIKRIYVSSKRGEKKMYKKGAEAKVAELKTPSKESCMDIFK